MGELDWEKKSRDQQIELLMDQYGEEIKRLVYTYRKRSFGGGRCDAGDLHNGLFKTGFVRGEVLGEDLDLFDCD